MAGSSDCDVENKEKSIEEIQTGSKAGRSRALQLLAGDDESSTSKPITFLTQVICKMDRGTKLCS